MIYDRIKTEYERKTQYITSLEQEINSLPQGKLICCHQEGSAKWYCSDGHKKTYIPKSQRPLAEQLAKKKYLLLVLEDLKKEQTALEFYLRHHSPTCKSQQFLQTPSEYQNLLSAYFQPLSQELTDWMNTPYNTNTEHPENLIHKGIAGNFLRSKSEVLIDMLLRTHNIPFRYESSLSLGGITIYPDFTIRHPTTGNYYYWEHFGLMDLPSYIKSTSSKLELYASNGIIPGIHLITTFETKNHPLTPEIIEMYINYYFK